MTRWTAGATVLAMMSVSGALGQVYLRGQGEPLGTEVMSVESAGVVVRAGEGTKTIAWDRVREVRGEHGGAADAFAKAAGTLWRGRTRLERGDFVAAEPLLESLVDVARSTQGPTSSVVFEGVLRCRLRRGAQASAVWAWLDWVRARGGVIGGGVDPAAHWVGGRVEGSPVVDPATGLVMSMPPVFLRDSALDAAASGSEWERYGSGADVVTAELAALYRDAARYESAMSTGAKPTAQASESVRLVSDMVLSRVGNDQQRAAARAALEARITGKEVEPWLECWCRVGIGRSLLREAEAEQKRLGIVQLLHAPARFVRVSPSLAALALAEGAVALNELGDESGARALRAELMDRFGRSAAAGWSRLREIRPAPASDAGAGKRASEQELSEKKGD